MTPTIQTEKAAFRVIYLERDIAASLMFIRAFGPHVSIVSLDDPQEALELLQEGEPADLVLINENLGGLAFAEILQGHLFLKNIPVVLLSSGPVTEQLKRQATRRSIQDVLPAYGAEDAIAIRIDYLRRRKEYQREQRRAAWHPVVRMPVGKRLLDILVSLTALLLLSPLLLVVSILIKLDSRGPVFYSSRRVGMNYRVFPMHKFRTMRTDADQMLAQMADLNVYARTPETDTEQLCEECRRSGQASCGRQLYLDGKMICEDVYALQKKYKATFTKFNKDPRVTRLGQFLRNTSIDELPQLFNILSGDMSLVGNRPLPPYEAEKLTTTAYARRFAAPAGLTGLWQVTKRGRGKRLSDEERIQLDVLYAKTFSFRLDVLIFIRTLKALWQKEDM
ncbi:sugar transferase [Tellurirhabdus rosea]|uniref:sugar transferase n=1 Tax=Tellurirhabdus rosea TaxID=2674997 RepID=UPI00224F6944|nr:sugar transferase [Tellurirhabdus rosea]